MRFPQLFLSHGLRLLLLGLLPGLVACGSTNRLLKARPVALTPFFEQPQLAQDARKQLGFQKVWTTPDREVLAQSLTKKKLYIAPVTLAYLRPVKKTLASQELSWGGVHRQEQEIAHRLRQEFAAAFQRSPRPLYQLTLQPGPDTLVLQLALTELSPTSPKGNAVMTLMKVAVSPVVALGKFFTSGNMAIEGKMLVPMTPTKKARGAGASTSYRAFFQFADNESDKLTFLNARDFSPYGHAVHTMQEWATHFEEMTRTPRGSRVKDSSAVTLRLY